MSVRVYATNEQDAREVDSERWIALAEKVLLDEGVTDGAELTIHFVDPTRIAELNKEYLGHTGPTDVLSFPIEDDGDVRSVAVTTNDPVPVLLGDVVLCPEVAFVNVPEHAGSYDDELALLLVHGILHLLGLDHEDPDEAEAMEARERVLLAAHHGPDG